MLCAARSQVPPQSIIALNRLEQIFVQTLHQKVPIVLNVFKAVCSPDLKSLCPPLADNEDLGAEDDFSDAAGPPVERRKFASWASPELLAFLASAGHDVSKALRKDAVSSLVWEYIHEKQLLNPKKKTEVLCDEALERLFKRKAVGRLEMNRWGTVLLCPFSFFSFFFFVSISRESLRSKS
jgi:hypothetical protein